MYNMARQSAEYIGGRGKVEGPWSGDVELVSPSREITTPLPLKPKDLIMQSHT